MCSLVFNKSCFIVVFSILCLYGVVFCLKAVPERAFMTNINKKYMEFATINVKRYGRNSDYYVNAEGATKQTWTNNVTVYFVYFELLHNEYRRSFLQFSCKFCDLVKYNEYFGAMLTRVGIGCPLAPGVHHLTNLSVPMDKFPNEWPFERTRIDIIVNLTDTTDNIFTLQVFVHFIKNNKKKIAKLMLS